MADDTVRITDSADKEILTMAVPDAATLMDTLRNATVNEHGAIQTVKDGVIQDNGPGMSPTQLQSALSGGMTYEEVLEMSPALAMLMDPGESDPDVPMDIYGTVYCDTKRLLIISANAWHFGVAFTLDERLAIFLKPDGNHILNMIEMVQVKRVDGAMEQIMRASMLCSTVLSTDPVEQPLIDIRFRDWVTLNVPDRMRQSLEDGTARQKVSLKMAPADFLPDMYTNVTEADLAAGPDAYAERMRDQ